MDDRRWVSLGTQQLLHSRSNMYQHNCTATAGRVAKMDEDVGDVEGRRASLQQATFTHIFTHEHSHPHKDFLQVSTFGHILNHRHPHKDVSLPLFYRCQHLATF